MGDFLIRHIDDVEGMHGGGFKLLRREMGVTAFGVTLATSPPNDDQDPEHDHLDDGQEELYIVLEGAGTFTIDGEPHAVRKGHLLRVGPGVKRKMASGPEGMQVLTIGGVPGKGFEPNW